MRLLIATPLYPPEGGGPATYAKLLAEGLPSFGATVTVERFSEVRKYPKILRHIAYLIRLLRAGKGADVVLVLDPVSTGLPATVATILLRKPLVLKVVGDYAWEQGKQRFGVTASLDDFVHVKSVPFPVSFLRMLEAWVARRANKIIVPSEYLKGIVCAWGIPETKIVVVPNAVAATEGGAVPETIRALKCPMVATVARLVPWKGIIGLIDAVAEARATVPELSLAIVGEGPDYDALSALAQERLGSNYALTGGLAPADTQAILRRADIFVLNSTYEGLSHVLIEALLSGKAIIATRAGGNEEALGNDAGVLIPVADTAALTRELARLAGSEELRKELGERARHRSERFTVPVMLERTREAITRVL